MYIIILFRAILSEKEDKVLFSIKNADAMILNQIETCNLFDSYRIVDVNTYLVYDWHDGKKVAANQRCYEVWKRGDACKNCISRTSILEKKRIIKLEYFEGQIYLIVAVPIMLDDELFSLELVCNVTDSLVVNDSFHTQNMGVQEIIHQMNDAAVRDPHTGIFNKRYAEQELCKAVLDWKDGDQFFVGVLDIDHFKLINDTYGHVEGDEVLHVLAQILVLSAAQGNGWASRIGGDEFMIVWNGVSPQAAQEMVRELQEAVGAHIFTKNDIQFTISVSVGLAEYRPEFADWKEFLEEADQKMYAIKRGKYNPA